MDKGSQGRNVEYTADVADIHDVILQQRNGGVVGRQNDDRFGVSGTRL
jgi:hypothetical protein